MGGFVNEIFLGCCLYCEVVEHVRLLMCRFAKGVQ